MKLSLSHIRDWSVINVNINKICFGIIDHYKKNQSNIQIYSFLPKAGQLCTSLASQRIDEIFREINVFENSACFDVVKEGVKADLSKIVA